MSDFFEYLEEWESFSKWIEVKRDEWVKKNVDFIVEYDIDLNKIIECIKNENHFFCKEYLNDKLSLWMNRNEWYNDFDRIILNEENMEKFDVMNKLFNYILENEILRIRNSDDYENKDFLILVISKMYYLSLIIDDWILSKLIDLSKYEPELASQITIYKYAY